VNFEDPTSITYGGGGFTENPANDGSVSGSISATLSGDSYLTPLDANTNVTLGNIPTGLVPSLSVELGTADWAAQSAEDNQWRSVTYGNNQFVAVAADGTNRVMTSPDGITWTPRVAAEANRWSSVTYGNGLFVAVSTSGTNQVMTSPDGITWTSRAAAEANLWFSVTYGNGQFVAVALRGMVVSGTNQVMTSADGITWTARAAAEANSWYSVTYGNGQFVAVAQTGTNRVMTSTDGITWTPRAAAEANGWDSVTYGNGQFVAVAQTGTNQVMTSTDGITWTARAAAEGNFWRSVTYGNGLFVAVAADGANRVMTSPDGITWTPKAAAEANGWFSVTYGNGQFVAVAADGTNRVMTASADTVATLTLSGNADEHAETNDLSDITFDFADSAFHTELAANITNATGPASTNLGVDFDDPNLVNLSVSSAMGAEADGTVITLTATASRAVEGNQTVNITTTGTAIAGSDYLLSNTIITLLDGQTSGNVTFTVQDDAVIESLEAATLTLVSPSISLTLGSTISQNIAITDNPDADDDTIPNDVDNCPNQSNADQADLDSDNIGDVCDSDADNDQVSSATDVDDLDPMVCLDTDFDSCDDCRSSTFAPNDDGLDTDGDGLCDVGDLDDDNDEIPDDIDNCPLVENLDQNPSLCEDEMCFPIITKDTGVAVICL
jgi:hypothetical protein